VIYPWQRWEIPAAVRTAAFLYQAEMDQGGARSDGGDHLGLVLGQ